MRLPKANTVLRVLTACNVSIAVLSVYFAFQAHHYAAETRRLNLETQQLRHRTELIEAQRRGR